MGAGKKALRVTFDDRSDNRFHEPVGRFTKIVEDELPLHLLTMDYTIVNLPLRDGVSKVE